MEGEKTSCKQTRNSAIVFKTLTFKKCIFMTDDQFNKQQIHKPKQTLFIEEKFNVNNIEDVDNYIFKIIDSIHSKLIEVYNPNIKIPFPIYIMLGRELEYHSNLFNNETFIPLPYNSNDIKYGNIELKKKDKQLVILDYLSKYFETGLSSKSDEYKYDTSIIKSYQFRGRVRIYLYVPFLTNEYKFVSNLNDLTNSFYFYDQLINSDYYMNINRTSTFDANAFRKKTEGKIDDRTIEFLIKMSKEIDSSKYHLYDDLINLCYDGGCVSDIGDDFNSLTPTFTGNESQDNENVIKYSPFMPNKCLSKTNGYICNVKNIKGNTEIHEYIRKNILDDIQVNLSTYTYIADKIRQKNEFMIEKDIKNKEKERKKKEGIADNRPISQIIIEQSKEILKEKELTLTEVEQQNFTKYQSPIDLVVSVINDFIKNFYSENLKDKNKEKEKEIVMLTEEDKNKEKKKIDVKINHYSKVYSENIIKELAYLKKMNGIPEFVMSMYIFKEELKKDKIMYMPFKKNFPTKENVFNFEGDKFEVDEILYSFNKKYGMKLTENGLVSVFEIETNKIFYLLNRTVIDNPIEMSVAENGIFISSLDNLKNKKDENYLYKLKSLVDNCEFCKPPFS